MEQEQIKYKDIIDLGFSVEEHQDDVYFNEYGFGWCIITKDLTDTIYLDWVKETRLCTLIRVDNPEECNIVARMPIMNLEHLKIIDKFFTDKLGEGHYGTTLLA